MKLFDTQVNELARPLVDIIISFYEKPENEEAFQKWLRNVEESKIRRESIVIS